MDVRNFLGIRLLDSMARANNLADSKGVSMKDTPLKNHISFNMVEKTHVVDIMRVSGAVYHVDESYGVKDESFNDDENKKLLKGFIVLNSNEWKKLFEII